MELSGEGDEVQVPAPVVSDVVGPEAQRHGAVGVHVEEGLAYACGVVVHVEVGDPGGGIPGEVVPGWEEVGVVVGEAFEAMGLVHDELGHLAFGHGVHAPTDVFGLVELVAVTGLPRSPPGWLCSGRRTCRLPRGTSA